MAHRYQVSDGIVLRRKALPSGDVIVTLLSPEGSWRAIARKGKLPGGNVGRLSLFHDVTVQHYRKRDEDLALLVQVRLEGALPRLSEPERYPYAHLLAELADAVATETPPDPRTGERLYAWVASGLRGLDRDPDPERVAIVYAWRLLALAGLAPRAGACGACGADAPPAWLDVAEGALTCEACALGVRLGEGTGAELASILRVGARDALALPLADRTAHRRALQRYCAYHVAELRSLTVLAERDLSEARSARREAGTGQAAGAAIGEV